jgi:hypothetical protein
MVIQDYTLADGFTILANTEICVLAKIMMIHTICISSFRRVGNLFNFVHFHRSSPGWDYNIRCVTSSQNSMDFEYEYDVPRGTSGAGLFDSLHRWMTEKSDL